MIVKVRKKGNSHYIDMNDISDLFTEKAFAKIIGYKLEELGEKSVTVKFFDKDGKQIKPRKGKK